MLLACGHVILGEDGIGRAFGLAQGAVDALVGVDDQKIRTFMEAIDRADFHTVGVFAFDAVVGDDEGHGGLDNPGYGGCRAGAAHMGRGGSARILCEAR